MTNNDAWKKLFADLRIVARLDVDGRFDLEAAEIKALTGKEPRNMSKWDTRDSRPDVLKKADITILPTSRHGYTLVRGDGYLSIPAAGPARYHSPARLQTFTTLPWKEELTKESAAIDVAAISLMLQKFTGDHELALTIRGRSGTPAFAFRFRGRHDRVHRLEIDRAQIEVDAGFEGEKIWLLEAKLGEPADFLVRQLYYPWRLWRESTKKEVVPLFLSYVNKTFGLFRYTFDDVEDYHSVRLCEHAWFTLDEPSAVRSPPDLIADAAPVRRPPGRGQIPFPQADTLGTVITTVELFAHEASKATDIAAAMNFNERQGGYYSAAARWLGFIDHESHVTALGAQFVHASRWERFGLLFRAVAATPVFREVIQARLEGRECSEAWIADMIHRARYTNETTARRRTKTVVSWRDWLWREYANLRASG